MKIFLNEIRLIDNYLHDSLSPTDRLSVEARIKIDSKFQLNFLLQRKIHQLVLLYFNKRIKTEAQAFHERIFNDPLKNEYKKTILQLFK